MNCNNLTNFVLYVKFVLRYCYLQVDYLFKDTDVSLCNEDILNNIYFSNIKMTERLHLVIQM